MKVVKFLAASLSYIYSTPIAAILKLILNIKCTGN